MEIGIIPAQHSVHTLLGTLKWLQEDPENRRVKPRSYDSLYMNLQQFKQWFRGCLEAKITSKDPRAPRTTWRKMDYDWQRTTANVAARVNRPRIIVREGEVPKEFRERLSHRITQNEWI